MKKLSLILAAIAVMALGVTAAASAAPALTQPTGTLVKAGTIIVGTSVNAETTTPFGTLKCTKVTLEGKVNENAGSKVHAVSAGKEGTTTTCSNGSAAITITDVTLTTILSTSSGSGTAAFTFVADVPLIGTCHFSATAAPFTYVPSDDGILKFTKAPLTASPALCGPSTLDGEFTLETTDGKAVAID